MPTNNGVNTSLAGQSGTGAFLGDTAPIMTLPDMSNTIVANVASPVSNLDGANKQYVDTEISTAIGGLSSTYVTLATAQTITGIKTFNADVLINSSNNLQITNIVDNNGANSININALLGAVNYFRISNSSAGSPVEISAIGADTNIPLNLQSKGSSEIRLLGGNTTNGIRIYNGTSRQHNTMFAFANTAASRIVTFPDATGTMLMTGVAINSVPSIAFSSTSGIIGTTTNDNAASGSVGEVISSIVSSAGAIALTSNTITNISSIVLTAGDWDISGQISFQVSSTTSLTQLRGWLSTSALTLPTSASISVPQVMDSYNFTASGTQTFTMPIGTGRISLSSPATLYLDARAIFTISTLSSYGWLFARRMR